MPSPSALTRFLAKECALQRPNPSLLRGPPDAHLALAILAALPVWWLLALGYGGTVRAPHGAWTLASFVLLGPLVEELLFRGLLQGQLLRLSLRRGQPRRLGAITWANGLTTIAFVVMHVSSQPLLWALAVALPSLVFGHLRERFASVWPAAGLHMVYNAGFAAAAWAAGYHDPLP